MASTWPSERGPSGMAGRSGPRVVPDGEANKSSTPAASLPPILSQDTRFLLSPMPASMAQGQNQGQGQSKSASSTTITLYPLESVPSHLLCAICTLPYENPVHFLPCCHVFCLECIQLWIVMNLGDELLQNELRRAYPAEEERQWILNEMAGNSDFEGQSQHPHLQQQFMVELARMGHSRSRSGASGNNFYESFNHFSPAQQQLLQQQQVQQRIALLLESREMPKCPMCRTTLHIHGWDRIEELIKLPTPTRPRPINESGDTLTTTLSFSDWMRGSQSQVERPVSGVERRRRHDRFTTNRTVRGGSRGGNREEAIGEEEDEEIEMEHVRTSRSRINQTSSSGNAMSPFPSSSSNSSFAIRYQHRLDARQQDVYDINDEEDIQSPLTAVIGRRPSELMRYQQRQHQERQQANRQRAAAVPVVAEDSSDVHSHAIPSSRLNEQQEQIRRLYLEQESQEELLRTLTARAASIIQEEEENRRRVVSALTPPASASDSSNQRGSLSHNEQQESQLSGRQSSSSEHLSDRQELAGSENLENEHDSQRVLVRQSTLQIDTTLTRPNSRQSQSQAGQNPSARSRQISYDPESRPEQGANASSLQSSEGEQGTQDSASRQRGSQRVIDDEQLAGNNIDNAMISDMQQETLAWAQRPSSLRLDLGGEDEPLVLSTGDDDDEGDMSASDSVSNSTMSSSASSDIQLSPSNESTLSYGTTSTFSHSILNQTSAGTPFSQRSPTHPHWDRHSISLQMPTIETEESSSGASHRDTLESVIEAEGNGLDEQPWNDHRREGDNDDDESHTSYHKEQGSLRCGEFSGSTLDIEMSRAESKSKAEEPVDNIEGEARPSSSSSLNSGDVKACTPRTVDQDTYVEGSKGNAPESSAQPDVSHDQDSTGTSSSYGFRSTQSVWMSRSSGASPLVRDLDIHCPIVTAEGSTTTIANMQIDADILARARSNSILLSDDDLPNAHDRLSPIDSPIPTPSTARPRQRFPAGFPLLDDEGQPEEEEEEEEEVVEMMDDEVEVMQQESEVLPERPASTVRIEPIISLVESEAAAEFNSAPQLAGLNEQAEELEEAQSERASMDTTTPVSSQPVDVPESIQDPLSAAIAGDSAPLSLPTDVPFSEVVEGTISAGQERPITTPSIGPLRESLNSPPPLPLPLAAVVQPREASSPAPSQELFSTRDISAIERDSLDEESSLHIRPSRVSGIASTADQEPLGDNSPERAERPQPRSEDEPAQFRTVVRYQPRLPKAHVMSDLISQIRVECPNKQFGCTEVMEMQQTLQHGRDLCQFRMVKCPRARCGLWMRADQILEHILMVEPSSPASSFSSSSTPLTSGPSSARSISSSSGRSHKNGLPRSKTKFGAQLSTNHQCSNSHDTPIAPASSTASVSSSPNPLIPACPGLTWEREQLAKATGIIGNLSEENSGLRQTIRQLTLQNTKLNKEKDRLQRYANLGLGRD